MVPDRYIVQFEPTVQAVRFDQLVLSAERATGGLRGHTFRHALRGFSITLPANVPVERLRNLPGVRLVEPDRKMYLTAQTIPTGVWRINAHRSPIANINGIDQRVNIGVAVVDTGIQPDHPDLNVIGGRRFYSEYRGLFLRQFQDNNYHDNQGHGTHVAGIIGALDNNFGVVGVAPGVRLWSLRVFNDAGESYLTDLVAAIDWVVQNADAIEVINISLRGEGYHNALHSAIQNAVAQGIVVFAGAGNDAKDIYGADGIFGTDDDVVPAAFPEVAAISALADRDGLPGGLGGPTGFGPDDSFATFSNFSASVVADNPVDSPGAAVDLMMPGTRIRSTDLNGSYSEKWGTSMASPHAAGLAALYIAANGRPTDAAGVYALRQALINSGSAQTSPRGLKTLNDNDGFHENLGYIIPADFNDDGVVDENDLAMLITAWLTTEQDEAFCRRCDIALPPDNAVDIRDLAEFTRYWLIGYD